MSQDNTARSAEISTGDEGLEAWVKPEIVSFEPAKAAEGISYNPYDGIQNLT